MTTAESSAPAGAQSITEHELAQCQRANKTGCTPGGVRPAGQDWLGRALWRQPEGCPPVAHPRRRVDPSPWPPAARRSRSTPGSRAPAEPPPTGPPATTPDVDEAAVVRAAADRGVPWRASRLCGSPAAERRPWCSATPDCPASHHQAVQLLANAPQRADPAVLRRPGGVMWCASQHCSDAANGSARIDPAATSSPSSQIMTWSPRTSTSTQGLLSVDTQVRRLRVAGWGAAERPNRLPACPSR